MQENQAHEALPEEEQAGEQWKTATGEYDQQTSTATDAAEPHEGDTFGDLPEDFDLDSIRRQVEEAGLQARHAVQAAQRELARDIERMRRQAGNPLAIRPAEGPEMVLAVDSEYQRIDAATNHVLSFQVHVAEQACFRQAADGDVADEKRIKKQIASLSRILWTPGPDKSQRPHLKAALLDIVERAVQLRLLAEVPRRIIVVGFGLRFDLPTTVDFEGLKTQIDAAAGKMMTVHGDTEIEMDWGARRRSKQAVDDTPDVRPVSRATLITGSAVERESIKVRFVDMMAYVPTGTSLRVVGELVGLPKLDIPAPFSIERMAEFREKDRARFTAYAMRDAEIAGRYYERIRSLARQRLGVVDLPPTASALAMKWFLDDLSPEARLKAFGLEQVREEVWNAHTHRIVSKNVIRQTDRRAIHEDFLAKCYHGGLNLSFWLGPTPPENRTITDFDFSGAYTTGLLDIPTLDYEQARVTTSLPDLLAARVGFALVKFSYPSGTRVPGLPVRVGLQGLVMPLEGESYASAPELQVAHARGCEITVIHGLVFDTPADEPIEQRLFSQFVKKVREMRDEFNAEELARAARLGEDPRKSLEEQLIKLLGNSLYGRTCQGLRPKRAYDIRGQQHVQLRPSPITHPAIAAHATGFIRAALIEVLSSIPDDEVIVSATTDGFLTTADVEQIDQTGPMCRRFQALCDWVLPGSPMLEVKHRVGQVLAIKTRGQLTLKAEPGRRDYLTHTGARRDAKADIVLAKAGVQPTVEVTRDMGGEEIRRRQNDAMIEMYVARTPKSQAVVKSFPALRDQVEKGTDMVAILRNVRLSLEPDIKRRLVRPRELSVGDRHIQHLAADTVPWRNVEEFKAARARLEKFREERCMKTLADFQAFEVSQSVGIARAQARTLGRAVLNECKDGAVGMFRRAFLRAVARSKVGVDIDMSATQLAKALTAMGCKTTASQVKDAGRAACAYVEAVVPRTPAVMALCAHVEAAFPGICVAHLLIPEGL